MRPMIMHPLIRSALALLALAGLAVTTAAEDRSTSASGLSTAIFASGCFWCTESDFDKVEGVVETISGYTGGTTPNPTYQDVGLGNTGHYEALQVRFDPKKVSYQHLLNRYWRSVDLLDGDGQFCDRGEQYRPAIFVADDEQRRLAEESKAALERSGRFDKPIAVMILPATEFTPAEDYHQNYHVNNPLKYRYYRYGCGRDQRLRQLWGEEAGH
jgi:peptide-methionine (S)-S-oxide reductase